MDEEAGRKLVISGFTDAVGSKERFGDETTT